MSEPGVAKTEKTDVVLVGAGIMSATLGALLRQVEPDWSITLVERLDGAAAESSDPWNNAGTGHSALCELNYTPERPDGSIDISKAVHVNEQFQVTRQFWAYAVENGVLPDVRSFLNPIPHVSFVHGAANVDYLKRRYEALVDQSAVRLDGVHRRQGRIRAQASVDGRQARLLRPGRAELDTGRHRRRLRCVVAPTHRLRCAARHDHAVRARGAQPEQGFRRQLDAEGGQPAHRPGTQAQRKVRVRRRGWRRAAAAAEGRHQGGQGLRRLPGRRRVPAHGHRKAHRRASGQGVRPATAGGAADVGAALGHPRHQRQVMAAVRPVRRLVTEVLEAGPRHRSAVVGQAEQLGVDVAYRADSGRPAEVSDRPAAVVGG